jgi:hypothetical protein
MSQTIKTIPTIRPNPEISLNAEPSAISTTAMIKRQRTGIMAIHLHPFLHAKMARIIDAAKQARITISHLPFIILILILKESFPYGK